MWAYCISYEVDEMISDGVGHFAISKLRLETQTQQLKNELLLHKIDKCLHRSPLIRYDYHNCHMTTHIWVSISTFYQCHQTNTWTNVNVSFMRSSDIQMGTIAQEVHSLPWIDVIGSKIT